MITYTRESLNTLAKDFKLEMYNNHTDNIVKYITNAVVNSAKLEGKKEFINVVRIIDDYKTQKYDKQGNSLGISYTRQINQRSIDVYDSNHINVVIEKLKIIFIDLNIEYIESKYLYGNFLDSVIRINWD